MNKVYDKPITIQKIGGESAEDWTDLYYVHASINKARSNNEYLSGGAIQAKISLVFEIRYFDMLKEIALDTQSFRIVYNDVPYDIKDYDDYKLQHKTVKLLGVSY